LWESQIGWIEGRVSRYLGNKKYKVVDWGSRAVGWLEILQTSSFVHELSVREPLPPVTESMGFDGRAEIVLLIDVLQREIHPQKLLEKVAQILKPGGLLIAACRSGSGFDVLTLRESSESIFPLDHILLPSPKGMGLLFAQAGLDMLELTTPGLLDMQYVQNAGERIPNDQYFLRYILEQGDTLLLERMQGFLQRNNLSSHLRCVARRK
jgi:SAM-dependent methyltransferase